MDTAMLYIRRAGGVALSKAYPCKGVGKKCAFKPAMAALQLNSYTTLAAMRWCDVARFGVADSSSGGL
jgi:roadblock/LC7 domain-containing protein